MMKFLQAIISAIFVMIISMMNTFADDLSDMYNKVGKSIYQLYAIDKDKKTIVTLGSAVAITEKYLATNCHLALSGNFLIARINNTPYLARLCYYNQEKDLCIVDVEGVKLMPVAIRPTKTVQLGEKVYAVGDPAKNQHLVSKGVVKQLLLEGGYLIIENSAPIVHGSSGGGLFDKEGNLIGITTSGVEGKRLGYAIPTELILEVLNPKNQPHCMLPPEKICRTKD